MQRFVTPGAGETGSSPYTLGGNDPLNRGPRIDWAGLAGLNPEGKNWLMDDAVDVVTGLSTGIGNAAIGLVNLVNPLWYAGMGIPNVSEAQAYFHGPDNAAFNSSGYSYAIGQIAYTGAAAYALAPVFAAGFGYTVGFAGPVIATTVFGAWGTHSAVNSAIGLYDTYQNWGHLNGAQLLGAIGTPLAGLIGGYAGFRATPQSVVNNAVLAGNLDRFQVFGYRSYRPTNPILDNPKGPIFISPDRHVGPTATKLAEIFPNRVLGVNPKLPARVASGSREVDILMDQFIIQVKSQKATGLAGQISDTINTLIDNKRRVIGYAPDDYPHSAWVRAARFGIPIARNFDELVNIIKELSNP